MWITVTEYYEQDWKSLGRLKHVYMHAPANIKILHDHFTQNLSWQC